MKNSAFKNALLVLVSITATLFLCEYLLRSVLFGGNKSFEFLRQPESFALYYRDANEDFFNEDYWKLNYLFGHGFELDDPHPILGWTGFFDKRTYVHSQSDNTETKSIVLLYGDSFAMCVDSVDCFEDILNADTTFSKKHHLLNYGVGGYGLDQIYLLFKETVSMYQKPFVIFSVLTTDLDRSVLKVRDSQKPYFLVEDNQLVLKGVPISGTSKEFFTNNPPEIKSYLWNMLANKMLHNVIMREKDRQEYIHSIKTVNRLILKEAISELKLLNTPFIILIFQPAWHSPKDWRLDFIKNICVEEGVPFISDTDLRAKAIETYGYDIKELFIPNDGHPTTLSNRLISDEIKKCVLDSAYISSLIISSSENDALAKNELRKSIRKDILNSTEWMENITVKAKEKGLTIDSMINLDIEYMLEQQGN